MTQARTLGGVPAAASARETVLAVRDLRVSLGRPPTEIVRGISFDVAHAERVALVGESGSGKSVTAQSVMGILRHGIVSGSIRLQGTELVGMPEKQRARLRGDRISYIFQDPMAAMNPSMRTLDQVAESLVVRGVARRTANERAMELLHQVGFPEPAAHRYPHQLSGGMRQRAMIASALISDPAVVLADEPTTALDAQLRVQVLQLLRDVAGRHGTALVFITHDLSLMAGFAERVLVMYAGRIVESLPTDGRVLDARHPYSRALLRSVPRLDAPRDQALDVIPGSPPRPGQLPTGCPYAPRCPLAVDACHAAEPPLVPVGPGHAAACIRLEERLP
jgi:peptide/nickel transport system ATP-binding protein